MEDIEIRSRSGASLQLTNAEARVLLRVIRWHLENGELGFSEESYRELREFCETLERLMRPPS